MTDKLMEDLHEGALLRVTIPLEGGTHLTLDGAVEKVEEHLFVCIQDDPQAQQPIASHETWVLTMDYHGSVLLFRARLQEQLSVRRFSLQVESVAQHSTTRKSCRVDAMVKIREWAGSNAWSRLSKANTRQVTLSTSGIRFISSERFRPGQKLGMEITLPGQNLKTIQTAGEVIRSRPDDLSHYEVAVSFSDISQENIDLIETFFITHHFRTMHNRVKLLGEVLSPSLDHSEDPLN